MSAAAAAAAAARTLLVAPLLPPLRLMLQGMWEARCCCNHVGTLHFVDCRTCCPTRPCSCAVLKAAPGDADALRSKVGRSATQHSTTQHGCSKPSPGAMLGAPVCAPHWAAAVPAVCSVLLQSTH